ncbi:hypothetical protein C0J50_17777, partial [Silurus asotus]
FHFRNIAKLRNMLSISDAEKLIYVFMTSRLDYCNALLGGCPALSINKFQLVQNVAARVITRSRKYDHITPILSSLHWLPVKFRTDYKLLLLTNKALTKSTKGGRAFSHLAPNLWNSLPDGVRGSDTLTQFKCRLKTYLLSKA